MMLKKRFLALICGVIFSFGFAPFDLWLLSVLSVAVLVGSINKSSNKEAFLVGYAFGFGMWLSGISWLCYLTPHIGLGCKFHTSARPTLMARLLLREG